MHSSKGVTLIELMVIITIIGILIAVAIPSFTESIARKRLEGVANELVADLQYAKTQAASVNANVTLLTSVHGYTVSSATTTYKTVSLASTSTLTDAMSVTFEPHRALPASMINITVTQSQTSASLRVNTEVTGRIQMCSPGSTLGGYVACL